MKDHHKRPEITPRNTRLHGNAIKPEPQLSVGRWVIRVRLEAPELHALRSGNGIRLR